MNNILDTLKGNIHEYWEIIILSLPKVAVSLLLLGGFILLGFGIGKLFNKRLRKLGAESITVSFIVRAIKSMCIVTGIILFFHALGFEGIAGGLLAGAGIGAIIIGFAFKEIGENFLSGIILVFDRPYGIGDIVMINGNMGQIIELKLRTTHLKSFDGRDIYVPNGAVIRNDVYNYTRDGLLRLDFIIGIDYDDDIDEAVRLITTTVNANEEVLQDERTQVLVDQFTTNTVNIKVMFWINTFDYRYTALQTRSKIMKQVKQILLTHHYGLPANIQEIKLYKSDPISVIIKKEE